MRTMTHKGYGRIYCETVDDIPKVREIIFNMDEFEYGYLPNDLITVFTDYPRVTYMGKFSDLDMDEFTHACWKQGVKIWVFDSGHNDSPVFGGS